MVQGEPDATGPQTTKLPTASEVFHLFCLRRGTGKEKIKGGKGVGGRVSLLLLYFQTQLHYFYTRIIQVRIRQFFS